MSSMKREYSKCLSMLICTSDSVSAWMVTAVFAALAVAEPRVGLGICRVSPFLPTIDILLTRLARTRFFLYAAMISSDHSSGINVAALVLFTMEVLPPGYATLAMIISYKAIVHDPQRMLCGFLPLMTYTCQGQFA